MVDPWQIQADPEWAVGDRRSPPSTTPSSCARSAAAARRRRRWRIAAFAAGLALIAVALLSPLEHIALTSLLSVHLLQNVILADWAPPLLVLGLSPAMMAAAERAPGVRAADVAAGRARLLARRVVRAARPRRLRLRAHPPLGARPRAPRRSSRLGDRVLVAGARARPDAPAPQARLPVRRVHRRRARVARARPDPPAVQLLRARAAAVGALAARGPAAGRDRDGDRAGRHPVRRLLGRLLPHAGRGRGRRRRGRLR